mgnify:CR=1 FL=1
MAKLVTKDVIAALKEMTILELNELVKLSEKCSLSDNYQNPLISGGSEFLEKNDDINEH